MAASGRADGRSGDAKMEEKSSQKGYDVLGVVHKNGIIHRAIVYGEISGLCASQNIAAMTKCMVRLNKVKTTGSIGSLEQLKSSVGPLTSTHRAERNTSTTNEVFQIGDRRTLRFDRAGSTDSVAVSSGGSDHGGSDTCQSSDTTSVSDPYSPEAAVVGSRPGTPQPMPPIPDALREDSQEGPLQATPSDDVVDKCERWCRERFPPESKVTVPVPCAPAAGEAPPPADERAETLSPAASPSSAPGEAAAPAASATPVVQDSVCKWTNCAQDVGSCDRLVEHIRVAHVDSQSASGASTFVCLWTGCKVYNRSSCSISWLERHVVSHGGNKPFRCIVEGCRARFTSQGALERHVNSHFNGGCPASATMAAPTEQRAGRKDDTPTKLLKRRKMLRYRRRGWPAKSGDFFDAGMMEHVRQCVVESASCTDAETQLSSKVTFTSSVIARRVEESGKVRLLLHWSPEDILPDQWILETQLSANTCQSIPLWMLPTSAVTKVDPSLKDLIPQKRRRK